MQLIEAAHERQIGLRHRQRLVRRMASELLAVLPERDEELGLRPR